MNTMQLECFLAVAQHLNFSKAAQSVSITQPAVSHQILSLEDELGVKLFRRTSKSVTLTRAGLQFIGDANAILKIAGTARARLNDQKERDAVFIGVGCHNRHELDLTPPIFRRLLLDFPSLRPTLRLIPIQAMENLLESESIQVMFSFSDANRRQTVGAYQELCKCPIVCLCCEDHPFAASASLKSENLTGRLVVCGMNRSDGLLFELQSQISMGRPASEVFFGDGYESAVALVRAGLGCSVLPYLPTMQQPGLRCIPIDDLAPVSFGVQYKPGRSPVLRRFLDIARDELQRAMEGFPS